MYSQILGSRWDELDESLRRFHGKGRVVQAAGTFRVRHGSNWLVRFLAWLARLPAAGEAVDMQLIVTPLKQGEEWRRSFAGRPLVSTQWIRPDGLLAERMGPLELRLRLEVVDGALNYQTKCADLRLGPLRVPLCRWLAPRVTAWEKPSGDPDRTYVSVVTSLPLLGLLIAYEGMVIRVEAQA